MNFDTSLTQVTNWLRDMPTQIQRLDTSAPVKTQATTKRPQSSASNYPQSKRRRLLSPPASQRQGVEMEGIATPTTKRLAVSEPSRQHETDNNETPRAYTRKGKSKDSSRDPSASSQASSAYSRDSKRSRGSASPIKMWPLIGPHGHQLVRANPLVHRVPAVKNLTASFSRISRVRSIIPKSIQQTLEEMDMDDVDDSMFYHDEETDRPCGRDLIRLAQRIAKHSNTCSSQLQDEGAWNNLVHSRLLDMFINDMHDGLDQDQCDFMPCITTNMNLVYHRFSEPASRVDYIIRLLPRDNDDEPPECFTPNRMPSRNWTSNQLLPIAFSIETRRYGGDVTKGGQQLGIWTAAQWEFLISIAGVEAVKELEFIPGVIVFGEIWSLVITTRTGLRTNVYPGIPFGNSGTVVGVFQVIAGLNKLRAWALEKLWPWYKKHLPGLDQPRRSEPAGVDSGGGCLDIPRR
ncbi:hypothetical protein F66182_3669 [Fusarium sp. NRRL 66182]|nr:hypothetical protein F66182_3669 [Fusarium sp. NRRL 66182]